MSNVIFGTYWQMVVALEVSISFFSYCSFVVALEEEWGGSWFSWRENKEWERGEASVGTMNFEEGTPGGAYISTGTT